MLIGQDTTIRRNPEKVKHVLMPIEPEGKLTSKLVTLICKLITQS